MSEDFVTTRCSVETKSKIDFKYVAFGTHKLKDTKHKLENPRTLEDKHVNDKIDMKRAKFEVIKFGMSGFNLQKKEEIKVQLAIKLGAKPRKNKYKNYKLLQQERKGEQESEKNKFKFQQLGKNKMGRSNAKGKSYNRKRRKGQNILAIYGNVKDSQVTDLKKGKR